MLQKLFSTVLLPFHFSREQVWWNLIKTSCSKLKPKYCIETFGGLSHDKLLIGLLLVEVLISSVKKKMICWNSYSLWDMMKWQFFGFLLWFRWDIKAWNLFRQQQIYSKKTSVMHFIFRRVGIVRHTVNRQETILLLWSSKYIKMFKYSLDSVKWSFNSPEMFLCLHSLLAFIHCWKS